MQTVFLHSAELVKARDDETVALCRKLRDQDVFPHLAVLAVGETAASPYLAAKQRHARTLGIEVSIYRLPATATRTDLQSIVDFLNHDPSVHGILIQLPLPSTWSEQDVEALLKEIAPEKDVDGLISDRFQPTTARAMQSLAETYKLKGAKTVIIGRGRLVGAPLDRLLKGPHTVVDLDTKDGAQKIAAADLIFAGTDSPKPILNKKTVKPGVAIIAAGNEIDHASLNGHAAFMTPERGGVGPLTISNLLWQTVQAAQHEVASRT